MSEEITTYRKKKRKAVWVWLVMLFLFTVGSSTYWSYWDDIHINPTAVFLPQKDRVPPPTVTLNEVTIEYGDYLRASDLMSVTGGQLSDPEHIYIPSKLGTEEFEVEYTDIAGEVYTAAASVNVTDKTAPLMMCPGIIYADVGSETELTDYLFCGDNYDPNPKITVNGSYSFDEVTQYTLQFNASDINGNSSTKDFVLIVREPVEESEPDDSVYPVADFISKYKSDANTIGIDVSSWQGTIDWQQVKEAGIDFAMLRIGLQKGGFGGTNEIDTEFLANLEGAKAAGLKVGVYFYSFAKTPEEARQQARWCVEQLGDQTLELPIAFDWENFNYFTGRGISFYQLNRTAEAFIDEVENLGYEGMLYGSASYLTRVWKVPDAEVWIAHYTDQTDYEGEYFMWQVSPIGEVPGVDGHCDLNVLYK